MLKRLHLVKTLSLPAWREVLKVDSQQPWNNCATFNKVLLTFIFPIF